MFIRGKLRTEIKDNDDILYRYCQEVDIKEPSWEKYYFGLATKNGKNLNKEDMITDIDIHSIVFNLFDEELMPVQKVLDAERYRLLMIRKSLLDSDTGKLVGDVGDLFSKGIAHEVKTAQRKNLVFINEEDSMNEVLFKHFETLKGYRYNLDKFNQQLDKEIRSEDEQYTHLVSAKQLVKNQRLLNQLFEQADSMRKDIIEICDGTRMTLKRIIESDPVESTGEISTREQLQQQYAQLDKELTKGLERLHNQIDRMQLDVKDSIKLIMDYKKAYEDTYEKIPIDSSVQKERKSKRSPRVKPLDQAIVSLKVLKLADRHLAQQHALLVRQSRHRSLWNWHKHGIYDSVGTSGRRSRIHIHQGTGCS